MNFQFVVLLSRLSFTQKIARPTFNGTFCQLIYGRNKTVYYNNAKKPERSVFASSSKLGN